MKYTAKFYCEVDGSRRAGITDAVAAYEGDSLKQIVDRLVELQREHCVNGEIVQLFVDDRPGRPFTAYVAYSSAPIRHVAHVYRQHRCSA